MSADLIEMLRTADKAGSLPRPVTGETMDSYRLRVAHAGAVVGIAFSLVTNTRPAAEPEPTNPEPES